MEIPETPDDFYFHVFSVSKDLGVAILEPPFVKSTTRPVDFYCEAPEQVRRGESIGVRCSLLNRTPEQMEYMVVLKGSEDYSFINVEKNCDNAHVSENGIHIYILIDLHIIFHQTQIAIINCNINA